MQSKKIEVQCLCEGTGFISQVDSVGDDTELVECAEHNPAYKDFEIEFIIDGEKRGGSTLSVSNGKLDDSAATGEFFAVLRKNEKRLLQEAADEQRSSIIDNLTSEQEDKLNEVHAEHYHGTDDDMPDAFEGWLEDLSLDELKSILSLN
jgi:hypothetical protein